MPKTTFFAKSWFTENLSFKFMALILTIFLWLLVMGRDDAVETKELDIMVNLPAGYNLKKMDPTRIEVRIKGPPKILKRYFLQKKEVEFFVSNTTVSNLRLEVNEQKLKLPYGVYLVSISPRTVDIQMERIH
jgi:hypothetical protein